MANVFHYNETVFRSGLIMLQEWVNNAYTYDHEFRDVVYVLI